MRGVWTIYKKELVDTLRDRKTLIFMLLLPTLVTPALMMMLGNLAVNIVKKNAAQEVIVAASPDSQVHYRQLVHDYFTGSRIGQGLKLAKSPIVSALVKDPDAKEILEQIPPEIFEDSVAFERWTRDVAASAEEVFESTESMDREIESVALDQFDPALLEQADLQSITGELYAFYAVTIRGLGMVRFVDPATLPPAPDEFDPELLPRSLRDDPNGPAIYTAIKERSIHGYLVLPEDPNGLEEEEDRQLAAALYHDSTIALSAEANSRIHNVFTTTGSQIVNKRVSRKGLPETFLKPLKTHPGTNLASDSRIALSILGGLLPYLVIAFAFLGGIYPSIDLGAGEKERQTLETLLLAPVTRTEIALGKYLLILTTSTVSAMLGVTTMMLCFGFFMPDVVLQRLDIHVDPWIAAALVLLILPPAATFSGVFLALSIFARSFKEAQNYLSPLGLLFILPASAGLIPGIEINARLALIPMVNVSLLSRDFLKGDVNWTYYGLTWLSCLAFATVCIAACVYMFRREQVLFRT